MAKLKFYTLDVFSKNLFGGNPLAIFLEADKLSQRQMQCIAAEINYSETVFILKPDNLENSAKVKIFHSIANKKQRTKDGGVDIKCSHIYEPLFEELIAEIIKESKIS